MEVIRMLVRHAAKKGIKGSTSLSNDEMIQVLLTRANHKGRGPSATVDRRAAGALKTGSLLDGVALLFAMRRLKSYWKNIED